MHNQGYTLKGLWSGVRASRSGDALEDVVGKTQKPKQTKEQMKRERNAISDDRTAEDQTYFSLKYSRAV
jgi:hypothetical protein